MAWMCCGYISKESTECLIDFRCPVCGCGYSVEEWHTEYGDSLSGEHTVTCDCGHKFMANIEGEPDVPQCVEETRDYYDHGYTCGQADKRLGLGPLQMSMTSTLPGYARGYIAGYHSK